MWLLATLSLLIRTILTLLLPGAQYTHLLYTLLCVFFLIVDYRNWKVSPDCSIYTFLIGILILPYYLYLRRDNNGQKIHTVSRSVLVRTSSLMLSTKDASSV